MRFSIVSLLTLVGAVAAQKPISGQQGTVLVSTLDASGSSSTPAGCLMTSGKVTGAFTNCARFTITPPASGNVWDGATLNAGAGTCGWNLKDRNGPLMCGSGSTPLGFYDFDGKMATKELITQWDLDAVPSEAAPQTLYYQGTHPLRAVLTWIPA
ncbi:hypothetical protein EXIGLDRAFT_830429 [Exidia glandulosa HHB12029]|uniref:RNase T2-like C-terminal domain-containing protein n=1 Tax=Exidia glandulosa HHB12029 TaxID=1314781 RepID=A0A165NHD1_EXIGL|nr:hypothetical protein EXIGLDRAFT_830429 [Exidia glandulosa HHB12029]